MVYGTVKAVKTGALNQLRRLKATDSCGEACDMQVIK